MAPAAVEAAGRAGGRDCLTGAGRPHSLAEMSRFLRRKLPGKAILALAIYLVAAGLLWWRLPCPPRLKFGRDLVFTGFSPDGRHFATATRSEKNGRIGPVRVWETDTGREVGRVAEGDQEILYQVLTAPGGESILLIKQRNWSLWDARSGEKRAEGLVGRDGPFEKSLDSGRWFSADGETLVVPGAILSTYYRPGMPEAARVRRTLQIRDARFGGLRRVIEGAHDVALASDCRTAVIAEEALPTLAVPIPGRGAVIPRGVPRGWAGRGWGDVQVLRRRDATTGRPLATFPGWVGSAESLAISDDSRQAALATWASAPTGDADPGRMLIRRWDLAASRELAPLDPGPVPESKNKGRRFVLDIGFVGSANLAVSWKKVVLPTPVPFYEMTPDVDDTSHLVTSLWGLAADPPRRIDIPQGAMGILSADGRSVAVSTWRPSRAVRILELPSMRERSRFGPEAGEPIAFSPDGGRILMATGRPVAMVGSGIGWIDRVGRWLSPSTTSVLRVWAYDAASGDRAGGSISRGVGSSYGMSLFGRDAELRGVFPSSEPMRLAQAPKSLSPDGGTLVYPDWDLHNPDNWVTGEGFELWDVPFRRPWVMILGLPAAGLLAGWGAMAAGRWAVRKARGLRRPPAPAGAAPGR